MIPFHALIFILILVAEEPDAIARERARHQGVWVVTSFVADGRESPAELVQSITRTVDGDHVVWKRDGKSFAGTTVVLDPGKSPATIDVIPDGGPRRGDVVLGIYKLEGDLLTIGMAAPGKERPTSFHGEKGSGQTLMTFRRENPASSKTP